MYWKLVKRLPRHYYERMRYGVSFMDAWNLDSYLATVIARGSRQLSENAVGYPPHLTPESWAAILEDLAGQFEAYSDEVFDAPPDLERGFELLKIHFRDLWD